MTFQHVPVSPLPVIADSVHYLVADAVAAYCAIEYHSEKITALCLQMFLGKSESKAEGDDGLMEHALAVYSGNLVLAINVQSTMQRSELDHFLRSLIC